MKTRRPLSSSIDIRLKDKLNYLSDQTSIPITRLLDYAICKLYEEYKSGEFTTVSKLDLHERIDCLDNLD